MNKVIKTSAKVLAGTAGAFAASVCAYMPFVVYDASKPYNDNCDYLLILGGDIIGADTPSPQLFERMKGAAAYLNAHPETVAVPCGGCFRPAQKRSEADIIAKYLISQGVDENRIHLEDKSTTTFENFRFGLPIIEELAGKKREELKIAFLSSSYHQHRAGIIAKRCGIKNVLRVSVKTPGDAFKRFAREYFVAYELIYRW